MASFEVTLDDKVSPSAQKAANSVGSLSNSLGGLANKLVHGGSLMGFARDKLGELAEKMGAAGLAAILAAKAVAGVVVALWDMATAAISATQAKDAMRSTFDALGAGAGAGDKTIAMLDELGKTLPFTTDQMAKWAKSLMAAGIQGPALETSIKAVAAATAIMGAEGGAAADTLIKKLAEAAAVGNRVKIDTKMLKQLANAGISATTLAAELGTTTDKLATLNLTAKQLGDSMQSALIKKGKGPLEALGSTWDVIKAKFMEGFGDAFEDLGELVHPFMDELKSLFGEFNKGKPMAQSFASGIKGALTIVFGVGKAVLSWFHINLLKLYILFLRAQIAISPLVKKIKELLPASTVITILTYLVKGLAVVFGILAVFVFVAMIPILVLVAAIVLIGVVIYAVISTIVDLISWLMDLGSAALDAAGEFIGGLVDGIKNGVGMVIDAVKGLGGAAIGALKGVLGIHSPSAVMRVQGHFTSAGLAGGIEAGTSDVEAAARGAGQAAIRGASDGLDGSPGAAGKGAAGGGVRIDKIEIKIDGAGGDVLTLTEEAVSLIFERIALRQGLVTA